jgi:hypothetical protein
VKRLQTAIAVKATVKSSDPNNIAASCNLFLPPRMKYAVESIESLAEPFSEISMHF